ncbi:hypothetical protein [Streptomyces sp. N35]|uniref:hypothetical protein n=1 Tax=Streptomyces sp. N35 TaxID=2795730 RepID=UPI0018F37388|nr:hypothetical protein [Streptomyces sp. N35]
MGPIEDVFRFVALRDPEPRRNGPRRLAAPAYDPAAPTALHLRLVRAAGPRERAEAAGEYLRAPFNVVSGEGGDRRERPRFIAGMTQVPAAIREVNDELTKAGDRIPGKRIATRTGKALCSALPDPPKDEPELRKLLDHPYIHGLWLDHADSLLAVTYAADPPAAARGLLTRLLLVWELLSVLADKPELRADQVSDLLANGLVLVPSDADTPEQQQQDAKEPGDKAGEDKARAIDKLVRLESSLTDLKAVLRRNPLDTWAMNEPLRALLAPATRELLQEEGLASDGTPVPELVEQLATRAERIHAPLLAPAGAAERRLAVLREIARRKGSALDGIRIDPGEILKPVVPTTQPGQARLLSPPFIGELKVIRQQLRGYTFGEIAHVENVLEGETKERRHEIVDLREEETTSAVEEERERTRDSQTTERSELGKETQSAYNESEQITLGGGLSAAYGPYVQVTATAGYAKNNSRSESASSSSRFARELTERAGDRLRKRTEETRRQLTRRTVSELNRHVLKAQDKPVVGMYRWLNKEYCAQVYEYGLRALIEIGVSDPSANLRYARDRGAGLDISMDPPPPLNVPGTKTPLTPELVGETTWRTLAATFRVPDFPPPPAMFITVTTAFSIEAPPGEQAATSKDTDDEKKKGTGPEPPPLVKVNTELTVPNGYVPAQYVANVLSASGDPRELISLVYADFEAFSQALKDQFDADADWWKAMTPFIQRWWSWDPRAERVPVVNEPDHATGLRLLEMLSSLPKVPLRMLWSLRNYLDASRGWPPRHHVDLAIGPVLRSIPVGPQKITGVFDHGQRANIQAELTGAEPDDLTLPVAACVSAPATALSMTLSVICIQTADLYQRWQMQAYEAVLAAHASWESDFRAAVAQAETRRGVVIEGRNPLDNERTILDELKRSAVAMLGGVAAEQLTVVQPGDAAVGTPPSLDPAKAQRAGRLVRLYEVGLEWEHAAYTLYPYFWSGRADWPEAVLRDDPDPTFAAFLRAGYARMILPVRPGFEDVLASHLSLDIPDPYPTSPAPRPADDPSLDLTEEIRASQDRTGGVPTGTPWPVTVPTTLVALSTAKLPWEAGVCDEKPVEGGEG